ncbi:ankyrin repeat domain-containing protein [Candidatus Curtissbacteria bacterium]|nr:ankyrin repeat domain-containing protein [Candidatus Curtissbacteria bacterium]
MKSDIKTTGVMALDWAAFQGDLHEIQRLIACGVDLEEGDYDGRTAIHLAASEGQEEVVRYLIAKKVNINPKDRMGGTPLTDAIRGNHTKVVELLKKHGAQT